RLEARLKRHGELEKALERRKRSTCRTRVAAAQRALRGIERRLRVARRRRRQLLDRLELGERGVGRAARRELACEVEARRNASRIDRDQVLERVARLSSGRGAVGVGSRQFGEGVVDLWIDGRSLRESRQLRAR